MVTAHITPTVYALDVLRPAAAALLVVFLMSRIREPMRRKINAVLVAGFSTIYMGGGLGPWELVYVVPASYVAYRAIDSYRFVALGWLMHPVWDMVHHLYGNPIWPWMPTSSVGCAVFDPIVAIWAFAVAKAQAGKRVFETGDQATEARCLNPQSRSPSQSDPRKPG
jgi:Family of unknown function (DUF6010)